MMAAAMNVPVSAMETAGEGGAWGIALLASYMLHKAKHEPLETYLTNKVFAGENGVTIAPAQEDVDGFAAFMARYKKGLDIKERLWMRYASNCSGISSRSKRRLETGD